MTPGERERIALRRYAIVQGCAAGGVVLMLLGLWFWLGDVLRAGGLPVVGVPLFVGGAVLSMVTPRLLIRRWRTPPDV